MKNDKPVASDSKHPKPVTKESRFSRKAILGLFKKPSKKLVVIALAFILLFGGGAAAYYGVILPNKPANVLKKAVENTLGTTQTHFEVRILTEGNSGGVVASDTLIRGQGDINAKLFQAEIETTISGVKVTGEIRMVGQSLFVKVGDLTTVLNLVNLNVPELEPIINAVVEKISDQWIEIDNTLLKQSVQSVPGSNCSSSPSLSLSQEDISGILDQYKNSPFMAINGSSEDSVNGSAATKFEVEIDHAKAVNYLDSLSVGPFKALNDCQNVTESSTVSGKTPITLWVDKNSKRITKLALKTQEDGLSISAELTLKYEPISISKPEGAKPLMELIGEIFSSDETSSSLILDNLSELNN